VSVENSYSDYLRSLRTLVDATAEHETAVAELDGLGQQSLSRLELEGRRARDAQRRLIESLSRIEGPLRRLALDAGVAQGTVDRPSTRTPLRGLEEGQAEIDRLGREAEGAAKSWQWVLEARRQLAAHAEADVNRPTPAATGDPGSPMQSEGNVKGSDSPWWRRRLWAVGVAVAVALGIALVLGVWSWCHG